MIVYCRRCPLLAARPAQLDVEFGQQPATRPLAISHGYGGGFRAEWEWTGTRDVTPALATPTAIEFHESLGGAALMVRNSALVREAASLLAERWRTGLTGPSDAFAAMATVRLPLGGEASGARANALMRELAERHQISAAVIVLQGALWVRVAAQAYNERSDYERLATLFAPAS